MAATHIRILNDGAGTLRIEVQRDLTWLYRATALLGLVGLAGALTGRPLLLFLPCLSLFFFRQPALEISRGFLRHGATYWGFFLEEGRLPLDAIKEVRPGALRYCQYGLYRGPVGDKDLCGHGRVHSEPQLILDAGVGITKLPLWLEDEEQEWLADYLESLVETARRPAAA